MSHIPTQSGGAWNEMTGKETLRLLTFRLFYLIPGTDRLAIVIKVNRILEIASENDLPLISLVQSVSTCERAGGVR